MDKESENNEQTWLGTSVTEMCKGEMLWGFSIAPITVSKFHRVLYELPVTLKEPPQPHYNAQPKHWDDDYVRMPYSSHSLFVIKQNGEEVVKSRWDVIGESLSKPINSMEDFEKAINAYNNKLPRFSALHRFFNDVVGEEEAQHFFTHLLPKIIQLALRLPEIVPGSIPLLRKSHSQSVSLSQLQVASLLANAFLCTFIWRKEMAGRYPGINFVKLFMADERAKRQSCVSEKLKCVFHYFRRVTTTTPVGVITFERKHVPKTQMPRWDALDNNLGNTRIHINSSGTIEEGLGFLQVDFANKFVGGGVLGYGCVQEEIRFVICPELIISRLFTEELGDLEALVVTGVERYSNYNGYSDGFEWDSNVNDTTPFDEYGRRRTTISVIDATRFNKSKDQFHCSTILRETNKAYVGFSSREKQKLAPVATGNWGCGAFKGDPYLKSLIQLMACSATGRDLVYYSFGDVKLREEFYNMHLFLANNRVTVCQLWRYLCRFCAANISHEKLYSFIQQCHFDMKSQPSLKQFLSFTTQKRKTDAVVPSTSSNEEEIKTKKASPNSKEVQKSKEPSLNKFPPLPITVEEKNDKSPNDVIPVNDVIDSSAPKSNSSNELSWLAEMEKVAEEKIMKKMEDSTEISMEVDYIEESPKPLSFIEDKKKKITDYFSKMTNHVNSYL